MNALRTALIVAVPEASPAVDHWRERTCQDRTSSGVPPHVTVLVPFLAPHQLDEAALRSVRRLLSAQPAFSFSLREARRFPGVLYLAPEPPEPFVRLVRALAHAYPELAPYGGEIPLEAIVPHVTVALGDPTLLDRAEDDVRAALPIHAAAHEIVLLEEVEREPRRWRTVARLPLGEPG